MGSMSILNVLAWFELVRWADYQTSFSNSSNRFRTSCILIEYVLIVNCIPLAISQPSQYQPEFGANWCLPYSSYLLQSFIEYKPFHFCFLASLAFLISLHLWQYDPNSVLDPHCTHWWLSLLSAHLLLALSLRVLVQLLQNQPSRSNTLPHAEHLPSALNRFTRACLNILYFSLQLKQ